MTTAFSVELGVDLTRMTKVATTLRRAYKSLTKYRFIRHIQNRGSHRKNIKEIKELMIQNRLDFNLNTRSQEFAE